MDQCSVQLLDDIRTPECRAFAEAWQGWRGAELVPRRAQVRLEDIVKILPMVSVVEITSPEVATIRLFGTALYDAMGVDLTGLNFFDMITPEFRALRVARTCQSASQPCGSLYTRCMVYQSGRAVLTEGLALPVMPNDPSAGPQNFVVSMALDDPRMDGGAADPGQLPMPENFRFVDIGAGVPDLSLGLADQPPAKFMAARAS
jgi:hypothetical protein